MSAGGGEEVKHAEGLRGGEEEDGSWIRVIKRGQVKNGEETERRGGI